MGDRREIIAALSKISRRGERPARLEQRELEQRRHTLAQGEASEGKQRELEEAALDVATFKNVIARLTSMHHEATEPIDWPALQASRPPALPEYSTASSAAARCALDAYRPGLVARWLGLKGGRVKLERALVRTVATEARGHNELFREYTTHHEAWTELVETAGAVLRRELETCDEVIEGSRCMAELFELGCRVELVEFRRACRPCAPERSQRWRRAGRAAASDLARQAPRQAPWPPRTR